MVIENSNCLTVCIRRTDEDKYGGLTFEIEKGRLSFRLTAPYCNERRKAASEFAKNQGFQKQIKQ